mgnify:FL=1
MTLLQDGLYKVIAGFTTFDEVLKLIELEDQANAIERINYQKEKMKEKQNTQG